MQSALKTDIKTMALIGQGEFVSRTALMSFIEAQEAETGEFPAIDQDQINALKKWVYESSPYAPTALIRHHWTMAGLLYACPEFDQEKVVRLSERQSDQDEGLQAYRQQWGDMPYTRLVICTHAMLASLTKRRLSAQSVFMKDDQALTDAIKEWKAVAPDKREQRLYEITNAIYAERNIEDGLNLLPNIDLLIIDEGHSLEDAFCAALSKDVSLNSVLGDAKKLALAHPDVFMSFSELSTQVSNAKRVHDASADKVMPLDIGADSLFAALTNAIEQCITPKRNAGKAKLQAAKSSSLYRSILSIARAFRLTILAGNSLSNGAASSAAVMHWSPEKQYPRINVGRLNCSRELHYMWMNVANKSMVISGTIYENNPAPSCETLRRSLAIPVSNLMRMNPIHAQWQIDPVTLCMISNIERPDGRTRFYRPKANGYGQVNQDDRAAWLDEISRYTIEAHKSAKGGMLVLATAFADIKDFADRITPSIPCTVLAHAPGVTLESLRLKFLECIKNGERPILIAAGAA